MTAAYALASLGLVLLIISLGLLVQAVVIARRARKADLYLRPELCRAASNVAFAASGLSLSAVLCASVAKVMA